MEVDSFQETYPYEFKFLRSGVLVQEKNRPIKDHMGKLKRISVLSPGEAE